MTNQPTSPNAWDGESKGLALEHYLVGVVVQQIDVFEVWAHSPEEAGHMVTKGHSDVRHHHRESPIEVAHLIKHIDLGRDSSEFNFGDYMKAQHKRAQEPESRIIIPTLQPPDDLRGGGQG